MPRGDKTGPLGKGPKTGRGLGNCTESGSKQEVGFGLRMGRGAGMGRRQGEEKLDKPKEGSN